MTQGNLDLLFSAAREVPAQTSVEEVTAWVGTAAATTTGMLGLAAKLKLFIAKKSLFMLGSIIGTAGITTVAILSFSSQNVTQSDHTQSTVPQEFVQETTVQTQEIQPEEVLALNLDPIAPIAPIVPTASLSVRAPQLIYIMEPAVPSVLAPQIFVKPPKIAGIAPISCYGDKDKNVKGSGNVITKTLEIQPFTALQIGGIFDVYITQGSVESVKIEADDNLIDYVKVENIKDALVLNSECEVNIKQPYTMKIHVTVKDLKEITVNGIGDVQTEGSIRGNKLVVEDSGVGDVKLNLEYDALELNYSAVGNIMMSGNVKNAMIDYSGVGDMNAFELKVQNLELDHTGVGDTEVFASESLDIEFAGVGDVYYKGSPTNKTIEKNGIGEVNSR